MPRLINTVFSQLQKEHEALGFTFYSKKITNIGPCTLILFCSRSKQFTTFIYTDGECTRVDSFLTIAEDKAEKIGKQEVKPYTIKKNDKGFWEIEDIRS